MKADWAIKEMARSGRLRGMSDAQLTQGAGNLLMELDKLAKPQV